MKKPTRDAILDSIAFVSFSFLVSTGLLLEFFPRGGATIWGMGRHAWSELHFWIALAFVAVILVHLVQHGRWIASMARGRARQHARRRWWVLAGFIVVVALSVAPFLSPAQPATSASERASVRHEEPVRPDAAQGDRVVFRD
jgi:hypothetical protein